MKYICKEDFEINGILVGNKGDMLEITDAVPKEGETAEDVSGYCDIRNISTEAAFDATWIDIDNTVLEAVK